MSQGTTIGRWVEVMERLGQGWTQGVYARDSQGGEVDASDPRATCWCVEGAIMALGRRDEDSISDFLSLQNELSIELRDFLQERENNGNLYTTEWQDVENRTLEEVLDLIASLVEYKVTREEEI